MRKGEGGRGRRKIKTKEKGKEVLHEEGAGGRRKRMIKLGGREGRRWNIRKG